jgi:hypothetical protein
MSRESTIRSWLMAVSGYAGNYVYQSEQGAPKQSIDYITFSVSDDRGKDHDYSETTNERSGVPIPDDMVDKDHLNQRTFSVDVNVYSEVGAEMHRKLSHSDSVEVYRELLRAGGVVLESAAAATRAPTLGDTTYRPRFVAEYMFKDFHKMTETLEKVNEFEITGTVDGDDIDIAVP